MQGTGALLCLLVLGSVWTVPVVPELPEPLIQENFDLDQFMGIWYEIAVVSTCPFYMQRKRATPVMAELQLQHVPSERNFTMTGTSFRNGTCKQKSTNYTLTDTPGRFFHHVAQFTADVDTFVAQTSYGEYALIVTQGTEKPALIKTTAVKLYSRTTNTTDAVLDDYKALVRQHGMSDDAIIMNQYEGECPPGEQLIKPQHLVSQRPQRRVVAE